MRIGLFTLSLALAATLAQADAAQQASGAAGAFDFSIKDQGFDRVVSVYVPHSVRAGTKAPMILCLANNSPDGCRRLGQWDRIADQHGVIIAGIGGTAGWNEGSGRGRSAAAGVDDVAYVNRVLDEMIARYPVDPDRIYATGFSQSGGMVFRLAYALGHRFAAVAPHSAAYWNPEQAAENPPHLLFIMGDRDQNNPIEGGGINTPKKPLSVTIDNWTASIGSSAAPVKTAAVDGATQQSYRPGRNGAVFEFLLVKGLDHVWAGSPRNPDRQTGVTFDSTDYIWKFFASHPKPGLKSAAVSPAGAVTQRLSSAAQCTVDDIVVGPVGSDYRDTEVHSDLDRILFADNDNRLWVGALDAATGALGSLQNGKFVAGDGRYILVDANAAGMQEAPFGPNVGEWATSSSGHYLYYTKRAADGQLHVWRVRYDKDKFVDLQQVTASRGAVSQWGAFPSDIRNDPVVRFTYVVGTARANARLVHALQDANGVVSEQPPLTVQPGGILRPAPQTAEIFYPARVNGGTQVARLDPVTFKSEVITNDAGAIKEVWAYRAPHLDGALVAVAQYEDRGLRLWHRPKGAKSWQVERTIALPPELSHLKRLRSMEPVPLYGRSAPGDKWSHFVAFGNAAADDGSRRQAGEILLFSTDGKTDKVRRIDAGHCDGVARSVGDPEVYLGKDQVFIYYRDETARGPKPLRRIATGIKLSPRL